MRKQDYLIHLIQSLSPNESRYFRLFSSVQPGEKEYTKLFDALQDKTEYDATALSKELGITPAQLAERKHYLNQVLIKSLQTYQEQTSDMAAVYRIKEEAVTLQSRRLFDYALDHANKGLARAWQLELFELIAELLLTKYSSLFALRRFNELTEITAENKKAADILAELFEIYELRAKSTHYEQSGNKSEEFNTLMQHRLVKGKVEKLQSLKAQIAWFHIYANYLAHDKTSSSAFLKLAQAEVKHYAKHEDIKLINPVSHIVSYIRLAEAESGVGNYERAILACERVRTMLKPSAQLSKVRVDSLLAYIRGFMITQLRYQRKHKEALAEIQKFEPEINLRPQNEVLGLNFNYAALLFNLNKSKETIDKIEEIFKIKEDAAGEALPYIRPLLIMAHLDLGNYELVPYLIKATKAWMKRQKISLPEIELFFSFTYTISTAAETQRRDRWLKLQQAARNHQLPLIDKELNLKAWLDRKLER